MTAALDIADADSAALARLPRCACGAPAMAWAPGTEPDRDPDLLSFPAGDPTLVDRGEAGATWCEDCWSRRFFTALTKEI